MRAIESVHLRKKDIWLREDLFCLLLILRLVKWLLLDLAMRMQTIGYLRLIRRRSEDAHVERDLREECWPVAFRMFKARRTLRRGLELIELMKLSDVDRGSFDWPLGGTM